MEKLNPLFTVLIHHPFHVELTVDLFVQRVNHQATQ